MATIELPALYIDSVNAPPDASRPVLINRDPAPDEIGVSRHSTVVFEIVDTGISGVAVSDTQVRVNGIAAFQGGASQKITRGVNGPRSGVSATADTLRIVLDPISPFESEATIAVHVASATMDGQLLDETWTFTVEDKTQPKLIAALAIGPKTIRLAFDEPVQVTDTAGFTIAPVEFPAVTPVATNAAAGEQLVELRLNTDMTPAVDYEITVKGAADSAGNDVDPFYASVRFKGFVPPEPANRQFDLWSMLPSWNRREDVTGDLRAFVECLQEVLDWQLADVDRFPDIFDLEQAPETFLDLILEDLGNPFSFELNELEKRKLSAVLAEIYRQTGTAPGIENAIRFFLGINITAITPFTADTMVLGESELGVDWILDASERFVRYAFNVEVDVVLSDMQRRQLRAIVDYLKAAHTHFVDLIEPSAPMEYDHWIIGVSSLNVTSLLH